MEATNNTKSMSCPICGFAFTKPAFRCQSASACAKRVARAGEVADRDAMIDAYLDTNPRPITLNLRGCPPVQGVGPAVVEIPARSNRSSYALAAADRTRSIVDLNENPADALDRYIAELKANHAAAVAAGSDLAPVLAAQIAQQERAQAFVAARS